MNIVTQLTNSVLSPKVNSPSIGCDLHDLLPVSRFKKDELTNAISDMENVIERHVFSFLSYRHLSILPCSSSATFHGPPTIFLPMTEVPRMSALRFTVPAFERLWEQETPIVVTDVFSRLQGKYDPGYFIRRHGTEPVILMDCDTGRTRASKVAIFFQDFGSGVQRKSVEKLKVCSLL
jgi:hypothetical protein